MERDEDDLSSGVPVLAGVAGPKQASRARNFRRVGVTALAVVVVVACLGWLGPRDTTVSDEAGGRAMTVTHPQISRSGADSAIEIEFERDGGGPVRVELPVSATDLFGLETYVPAPASEVVRGDTLVLTYDELPPGDVTLRLIGRMPTRAQIGRFTHPIAVQAASPEPLEVTMRTVVLP